jgi:hypothetical protein
MMDYYDGCCTITGFSVKPKVLSIFNPKMGWVPVFLGDFCHFLTGAYPFELKLIPVRGLSIKGCLYFK